MMSPDDQKKVARVFRTMSEEALAVAQLLEKGKFKQAQERMRVSAAKVDAEREETDNLMEEFGRPD